MFYTSTKYIDGYAHKQQKCERQVQKKYIRGVTILQILDSIQSSILSSRIDLILDFYIYFF